MTRHYDLEQGENHFSCNRCCEFIVDNDSNVLSGKIENILEKYLLVASFGMNGQPDYSSMWKVPFNCITSTWAW